MSYMLFRRRKSYIKSINKTMEKQFPKNMSYMLFRRRKSYIKSINKTMQMFRFDEIFKMSRGLDQNKSRNR